MSVNADVSVIPPQMRYGASSSVARLQRINNLRPLGSDSGTFGDSFHFDLPSRQIVDLSTLSLYYTATVDGMTAGANGATAVIPASFKHFKKVTFFVGGSAVSGALCNHYHQLYTALVAASGNTEWLFSKLNKNAIEFVLGTDETDAFRAMTATAVIAKSCHMTADDFMGLPRSKNIIDQSLWGQVSIQVQLADKGILRTRKIGDGSATDANIDAIAFRVSGMRAAVSVLQAVPPQYISLLASRLTQTDAVIRLPYQDFRTFIQTNSGAPKIQVNTNCLDALVAVPLLSAYNTPVVSAAGVRPAMFKFNCGRTLANVDDLKAQWLVGSDSYPRSQVENAFEIADITQDSLHGNNRESTGLLFSSASDDSTVQYRRLAFLNENCVYYQRLSLNGEGYKDGQLTGISTAGSGLDVVLNNQNFTEASGNVLIAAMTTSCLVYSPASASVSVEA